MPLVSPFEQMAKEESGCLKGDRQVMTINSSLLNKNFSIKAKILTFNTGITGIFDDLRSDYD